MFGVRLELGVKEAHQNSLGVVSGLLEVFAYAALQAHVRYSIGAIAVA